MSERTWGFNSPLAHPDVKGRPIGARRYDHLHQRLQTKIEWAGQIRWTSHWIRHTMITMVEEQAGFVTAAKFAGHKDEAVTQRYVHLKPWAVEAAISAVLGYVHPKVPTTAPAPNLPQQRRA